MNYRHGYHAGNFADVFKHILLIALLQSLQHKPTACCYLDTHAGPGYYDLHSEAMQKTQECKTRIVTLWSLAVASLPEEVKDYLQFIKDFNRARGSSALRFYPGSPYLARALLRPQDRMIATELHPEEAHQLKRLFKPDKQ